MSGVKQRLNYLCNTAVMEMSQRMGKTLNKPVFVCLETGVKCCLRCIHCDHWKRLVNSEDSLSLEERKRVVIQLKKWLGSFSLNVGGGEPFLNTDTFPVIRFAADSGVNTFVNSNGFLINEKMADKIIKSGVSHLSISLESVHPNIHDRTRGVNGAYEHATRAIDLIRKKKDKNLVLSINTIIMDDNLNDLVKLVHYCKDNGLDGISFQPLMDKYSFGGGQYDSKWYVNDELWPKDGDRVKVVLESLVTMKNDGYAIYNSVDDLRRYIQYFSDPNGIVQEQCLVGLSNYSIDAEGNVQLCFTMKPVGNVRDNSPKDIWYGTEAEFRRKQIAACRKHCRVLLCNKKATTMELIGGYLKKKIHHGKG